MSELKKQSDDWYDSIVSFYAMSRKEMDFSQVQNEHVMKSRRAKQTNEEAIEHARLRE